MQFSPTRLTVARKRMRLTISRLAEVSGISRQMISAYSNGAHEPAPETLAALAKCLSVATSFLTKPDIDEIPNDAPSFRRRTKVPTSHLDGVRSVGRITLLIAEWIEERFNLPGPNVPTLPKLRPEEAAEVVRAKWGLGNRPIDNILHLLEAQGIRVFSLAEDFLDIDAFSITWKGTPYIWLNTRKSGERGRFDAAHELGHLVLHCEQGRPSGPKEEDEANLFAAAFLMPRSAVVSARLGHANAQTILAAKQRWKVSAMALAHRLHEINLTTDWEYRQACVQLSRMGYRNSEPDTRMQRESSQLLQKVLREVREEHRSVATLARDIGISVDELNEHVFGLAAVGLSGGQFQSEPVRPPLELIKGRASG